MEHKKYTSIGGSNTLRTQLYKSITFNLSRSAKLRLKWMEHFKKYRNARLTCRHFGISPDTFYLWKKRFSPNNPRTLEDDSLTRRPHKTRASKKKEMVINAIEKLKKAKPSLGKVMIARILQGIGYNISSSTVGRILKKSL